MTDELHNHVLREAAIEDLLDAKMYREAERLGVQEVLCAALAHDVMRVARVASFFHEQPIEEEQQHHVFLPPEEAEPQPRARVSLRSRLLTARLKGKR